MSDTMRGSAATEWRSNWTLVMAAAAGVSLSAVSTSSLGVMMEPMEQEFGWSRAQISFGTSLVSFIGMALATLAGLAIDRIGARIVALAAASLMCIGIGLMSAVQGEIWQWWALWALVGISASAMPTVWVASVSSHFVAARGLAVAIALSGSGISTSLVPIIAQRLVAAEGWRAAYIGLAVIWAIVVLPLALLFFRNGRAAPARSAQGPSVQGPSVQDPAAELPGLTARQGFASAKFYKLALAAFFSMSAGVAIILNLVPVLRSTGLTPVTAASVAGIIGIATITGRIAGGWLMDRMSAGTLAAISSVGAGVLPLVLLLVP